MRIALQLLLDLKRQPLHAPAHVRVTHRDPDAASRGYRDHDRNAFKAAAIADDDAPAWIRTRASFSSTSITAEAEFDDVDEEGAAGAGSMTTGANPRASAPAAWRISPAPFEDKAGANILPTRRLPRSPPRVQKWLRKSAPGLHRPTTAALCAEITVIRPMLLANLAP